MSPTTRLPRESTEWVGPITVTVNGTPTTTGVQFAVLPRLQRPISTDWANPVLDPGGSGALGVMCAPATAYAVMGVWAKITGNPEIVVLEPRDVGWIVRT